MVRNNSVTRRTGRPDNKSRKNIKIIETNPFADPENFRNAAAHAKVLGGNKDVWGSPIMKQAGEQRKGMRIVEKSYTEKRKMVRKAMNDEAMKIVKFGMPVDPAKAAEVTERFGPGVIANLLEIRRKYLLGEVR